jgi:hypothetical protein
MHRDSIIGPYSMNRMQVDECYRLSFSDSAFTARPLNARDAHAVSNLQSADPTHAMPGMLATISWLLVFREFKSS